MKNKSKSMIQIVKQHDNLLIDSLYHSFTYKTLLNPL